MRTPDAAFMRIVTKRQSLRPNLQGEKQRENRELDQIHEGCRKWPGSYGNLQWTLALNYANSQGSLTSGQFASALFPRALCENSTHNEPHSPQGQRTFSVPRCGGYSASRPPSAECPRGPSGSSIIVGAGAFAPTVSTNCPPKRNFCFRKKKIQCFLCSPMRFQQGFRTLCYLHVSVEMDSGVSCGGRGSLSWSTPAGQLPHLWSEGLVFHQLKDLDSVPGHRGGENLETWLNLGFTTYYDVGQLLNLSQFPHLVKTYLTQLTRGLSEILHVKSQTLGLPHILPSVCKAGAPKVDQGQLVHIVIMSPSFCSKRHPSWPLMDILKVLHRKQFFIQSLLIYFKLKSHKCFMAFALHMRWWLNIFYQPLCLQAALF